MIKIAPRFISSLVILSLGWLALLASAYVDAALHSVEWFNRSGAILVTCSAILEFLQLPHKESHSSNTTVNDRPLALMPVVPRSVKFFDRAAWTGIAVGTIVWGYGDLMIASL
ncbi:MAG: hypothetical protein OYH76_10330 [Defluviicoccus sp.]|nr:hypothetical protein [Bryobacterales bacterium]MDE0276282.1 hypothetical protein [Defluviicoccus sp.]